MSHTEAGLDEKIEVIKKETETTQNQLREKIGRLIELLVQKTRDKEIEWKGEYTGRGYGGLVGYNYRTSIGEKVIEIFTNKRVGYFWSRIIRPFLSEEFVISVNSRISSPSAKLLMELTEKIQREIDMFDEIERQTELQQKKKKELEELEKFLSS